MCGIAGIIAKSEAGRDLMSNLEDAIFCMQHRGPDNLGFYYDDDVGLGHARLSIIDTSNAANQPMMDASERYVLCFNGEIYNFKEIRQQLEQEGVGSFATTSDTEVLLYALITWGAKALPMLNGFFAFAFLDKTKGEVLIARDRYGIKPLYWCEDDDKVLFGSELKALMAFPIDRTLDHTSIYQYLQFSYIPSPNTIFSAVRKLSPGHYLMIKKGKVEEEAFYQLPDPTTIPLTKESYEQQQAHLRDLLEQAVVDRMVADVPLGTFLSGGIDSSIITGIASSFTDQLASFSIGFKDEPFYDETHYAEVVAKHFNTQHTVFKLSNDDMFEHLEAILNSIDEPFADSSAIAVYILSQHTRQKVTVALSGDGADELFGGYNKHYAAWMAMQGGAKVNLVKMLGPLWSNLPKSRGDAMGNRIRQLDKFSKLANLSPQEGYWQLAAFMEAHQADQLFELPWDEKELEQRKHHYLNLPNGMDMNQFLRADVQLVLENDMLVKVDRMSMANSLEVRVPFLDHRVVEYAFSLPVESKVNKQMKKRIVQDAYRAFLPQALYNRPKHGFEVPLLKWFQKELRPMIENDLLADPFVKAQGIFDVGAVQQLKAKLWSKDPGDVHLHIWTLLVFQWWWRKYLG